MAEIFFDLWGYFWAVASNWIIVVTTASPFVLDDVLKRVHHGYRDTLEKWVSAKTRRKWEIGFLVGGFVVANFLAYEGEHDARKQAEVEKDAALKQVYAMSSAGQEEAIKALQSKMEKAQIAFAEVEEKQQEEVDDLKSFTSTLGPRTITDAQSKEFVALLARNPKGPVAVFELYGSSAEVTNFANQLRTLLDAAGYSDADKPKVIENIFTSIGGGQVSGSCLVIKTKDPKDLPDYAPAIQSALKSLGIPADAIVDDKNMFGMKDKEIGVIVQAR